MVGDATQNLVSNPPCGIVRKLETSTVLEAIDSLHQTHVPLLDQFRERETSPHVLLGHAHDQPEVRADKMVFGLPDRPIFFFDLGEQAHELMMGEPNLSLQFAPVLKPNDTLPAR